MTTTNPAESRVAQRIACILAEELVQATEREEFGLLVQDIHPLDLNVLTDQLVGARKSPKLSTRLCLVDSENAVTKSLARHPDLHDYLTYHEETAVNWRNRHLKTIAVVASRPLDKAASLREFRVVSEFDLITRYCAGQRDRSQVTWLRTLWSALSNSRNLKLGLSNIVKFGEGLSELPESDRSARASLFLHLLNLFPDDHLADENSEGRILRRLQQNRELLSVIVRASTEDWNRIRVYTRSLTGKPKVDANRVLRSLKALQEGGPLVGLVFSSVLTLWKGKAGAGKGDQSTKKGGVDRAPVEQIVSDHLMNDREGPLADVSEEIRQIVQHALEDDDYSDSQTVQTGSSATTQALLDVDRGLLQLVRSRSTLDEWGGTIDVASDKPGALTEVTAFKSWTPFEVKSVLETLQRFVDEKLAPSTVIDALNKLISHREKLVPFVGELALSPVAFLAGAPDLLSAVEEYLRAYELVLRQLHGSYGDMHGAADTEAERIISQMLALETYVFRRDGEFDAVMSPLHPLYLWRTVTLIREIKGLAPSLAPHEAETVAYASADNAQFLQVLLLPPSATGLETCTMLGHAGFLGRLPLFREAPRGLLEIDGVNAIADMAKRIAQLRPYVRAGLQLVLINPPHPKKFVSAILDQLDLDNTLSEETFWGLHIRVRYCHPDTRGWANEFEDLDDDVRELISAGEERGLVTISLEPELVSWNAVIDELTTRPAHLTVVMDPFEVRSSQVARAAQYSLSPWMPSCEYRFNKIRKEIQVIPVAEEHVFGSYLSAAGLIHAPLQKHTAVHQPQVQRIKEHLDAVARRSIWTILADPHRVPIPRLGEAEVIDRRLEKGRQITCYAADLAPFVRRLDQQLRRTHFVADQATLNDLARDLVALEPNGILGLATTNHDRQVKGSLGKIIAVRWYRRHVPSGLAVSLDTDSAARWLVAGSHSREKADLIGLKEEGDCVVIEVLEVKTHDETAPYAVSDGVITGKAVDQLHATMQALAEVFTPNEVSPLARPRREVLREHLYTALLRDKDGEYIERWHALLADIFDGKVPVKISGRIVHVQMASVASKDTATYLSRRNIPITVETLSPDNVGLVLRPERSARKTDVKPITPAGHKISDRLEPAGLFARLSISSVADEPMSGVLNEDDDGNEETKGIPSDVIGGDPVHVSANDEISTDAALAVDDVDANKEEALALSVRLGHEHSSSAGVDWVPGKQSNGFFLILGASGSGKTESLKVIGSPISRAGVPVLVLDFHGDVILPGVPSVLLSSGSASTLGLNPLELDITSAEESGLYDQRASLRNMIQRAVPALGHRQSSILREAFDEAYADAGILDADPNTWKNAPPTFRQVQDILETWALDDARKTQRAAIEGCIAAVQELFDHPIFQRSQHVSVDGILEKSVRLDLSKLPDQIRFVATETLLRKIFRNLRLRGPIPVQPADDRQRFRLFVIIDEAKILSLGSGDKDKSDNILNELVTEARKFGLGMILASQMSEHFSEEVRANAATWLVLKPMDIKEAKKNSPNVHVEPDDLIRLAGRGDGYYRDKASTRAKRIQVVSLENR